MHRFFFYLNRTSVMIFTFHCIFTFIHLFPDFSCINMGMYTTQNCFGAAGKISYWGKHEIMKLTGFFLQNWIFFQNYVHKNIFVHVFLYRIALSEGYIFQLLKFLKCCIVSNRLCGSIWFSWVNWSQFQNILSLENINQTKLQK